MTAEMKRSVLLGVFNRRGGIGKHTRPFDDFDQEVRDQMVAAIRVRDGELPVLLSAPAVDVWTLITTDRVIISDAGRPTELSWSSIGDVEPDFKGKLLAGSRDFDNPPALRIVTIDGRRIAALIERGAPYVGVWNVLLRVIRMARRAT